MLRRMRRTTVGYVLTARRPRNRVRSRSDVSDGSRTKRSGTCDAYGWLPAVCFGGAWSRIAFNFLYAFGPDAPLARWKVITPFA
jgi:hypothetical protein